MVSEKKLTANRLNAKKSTGPRTPEGKARVSRNASTHGIFCRDLVLPGENEAEFQAFRQQFIDSLRPQDFMELSLVDEMVMAKWKLRRSQKAEKLLHASRADELDDLREEENQRLILELHGASRATLNEEEKKLHDRQRALSAINQGDIDAGTTLAVMIGDDNKAFERLSRYEQRLHYTFHRCLRELEQLRKSRTKQLPPSPYSVVRPEEPEPKTEPDSEPKSPSAAQNKPTAGSKTRKTDPDREDWKEVTHEDRPRELKSRVDPSVRHGQDVHATSA